MNTPPKMSKGLMMAMGLIGITPEMLASPETLLRAFGIDPDKIIKPLATFEQIGVGMMRSMAEINVRLAHIEAELGIKNPIDTGSDRGVDGQRPTELRGLGKPPTDSRN